VIKHNRFLSEYQSNFLGGGY
nr:Chain A, STARP antigen [Plasmodium falciparum]